VEIVVDKKLNAISNRRNNGVALCFLSSLICCCTQSLTAAARDTSGVLVSEARTNSGGNGGKKAAAKSDAAAAVTPGETTDGKPFIDKCLKASDSYSDYTFNYVQHVSKGSGVTEKGTVWVKKPALLKCDVLSGPNSGAVAIFNNGVVHAHPGGILKIFTVALKPDDARLKSANGWPMVESDFSSVWKAMQKYSREGCPSKVSAEPVSVPSQSINVLVLEMTKANGQMYKRALVDPKTMLPVEWWDYVDGKIYAHSNWTDFKGNQGLSETFFTMKGK
jgi:outer membrane lipoprotein-sorting protein